MVAGGENCNKLLTAIRARGGLGRPELQRKTKIGRRSSIVSALNSLLSANFIVEKNLKYYPTNQPGSFVVRKAGTAPIVKAVAAGQNVQPDAAAQVRAAEILRQAIEDAKRIANARAIEEAREVAKAIVSPPPPPPPEPIKESLFEKKVETAQLSPAEKLGRNLDAALDIDAQIMALGVDIDNLKKTRLVGEASGRTLSTAARIDETQLRREDYRLQNLDRLAGLLKEKYDDAGALLPKPKVIEHDG